MLDHELGQARPIYKHDVLMIGILPRLLAEL